MRGTRRPSTASGKDRCCKAASQVRSFFPRILAGSRPAVPGSTSTGSLLARHRGAGPGACGAARSVVPAACPTGRPARGKRGQPRSDVRMPRRSPTGARPRTGAPTSLPSWSCTASMETALTGRPRRQAAGRASRSAPGAQPAAGAAGTLGKFSVPLPRRWKGSQQKVSRRGAQRWSTAAHAGTGAEVRVGVGTPREWRRPMAWRGSGVRIPSAPQFGRAYDGVAAPSGETSQTDARIGELPLIGSLGV